MKPRANRNLAFVAGADLRRVLSPNSLSRDLMKHQRRFGRSPDAAQRAASTPASFSDVRLNIWE
jgi:hypothetical protein